MRHVAAIVTWIVIAAFVVIGCATSGQEADSEAVIERFWQDVGQYGVAVNAGDAEAYAAVWDENGIQMPPNGPRVVGREAIAEGMAAIFAEYDVDIETTDGQMIYEGGDYIVTHCNFTRKSTPKNGGEPLEFDGKVVSVWRRQDDGSWKLYIDCFNSNTP